MKNKRKPSITAFFPCYNDEKTIGTLVSKVDRVLLGLTNNYEIIVIDDGSSDSSRKKLILLRSKIKRLKLIFHKHNRGYGGALMSGFKAAKKQLIFYTDGDGQYDVEELPILLSLMSRDVNFVNGIKMDRKDYTYRIIVGSLYNLAVRWIFLLPIFDTDCDFRLIRKNLIKKISLRCQSGAICVELVKKSQIAGGKFRQVSVHHYDRKFGSSQFFRFNRIIKTFYELGKLYLSINKKALR